jgi:hypothetical protein
MSDVHAVKFGAGRRARETHPERIDLGNDTAVRNDLIAREQGATIRTVDRDDARGAPYILIAGVKYRPINAYRAFLAGKVVVRNQKSARRKRR